MKILFMFQVLIGILTIGNEAQTLISQHWFQVLIGILTMNSLTSPRHAASKFQVLIGILTIWIICRRLGILFEVSSPYRYSNNFLFLV